MSGPIRVISMLAVILVVALGGCRGTAENSVVSAAFLEAESLRRDPSVIRDPQVEVYVDRLGAMVLGGARDLEGIEHGADARKRLDVYDRYDVVIVHSPKLNAWVYGDDFVCVTSNLLLQAECPEEIVAVLCHEFAHLHEGHLVEAKQREYSHYAMGEVLAIAGQAAELGLAMYGGVQLNGLGGYLKQAHLSQGFDVERPKDEFEADEYAVKLYASMGLDLALFDDFLERIMRLYGDPQTLSHPQTAERLDRVRSLSTRLQEKATRPPRRLDRAPFDEAQALLRERVITMGEDGKLLTHAQSAKKTAPRPRASSPRAAAARATGPVGRPTSSARHMDRARSRVDVMGGPDQVVQRCRAMIQSADDSGMGLLTYRVAADLLSDVLQVDPDNESARELHALAVARMSKAGHATQAEPEKDAAAVPIAYPPDDA